MYNFSQQSYNPLYFCSISCDVSFTFDFTSLNLISFFLSLAKCSSILLTFSKDYHLILNLFLKQNPVFWYSWVQNRKTMRLFSYCKYSLLMEGKINQLN